MNREQKAQPFAGGLPLPPLPRKGAMCEVSAEPRPAPRARSQASAAVPRDAPSRRLPRAGVRAEAGGPGFRGSCPLASGPTHGHVNETLMNKSEREVNLETRIGVHVPRSC